jgi:hypothetical protein
MNTQIVRGSSPRTNPRPTCWFTDFTLELAEGRIEHLDPRFFLEALALHRLRYRPKLLGQADAFTLGLSCGGLGPELMDIAFQTRNVEFDVKHGPVAPVASAVL